MKRVAAFAAALAVAFAAAFAGGRVLEVSERSVAVAGGHGEPTEEHAPAAPAGLALADGGLRLVPAHDTLEAGRTVPYAFRVVDAEGRTVRDFEVEHERRLHLVVVRRELDWFLHVHPEQREDGTWVARLRLPADGSYRVFADFTAGGERRTLGHDLFGRGGGGLVPEQRERFDVSLRRIGDHLTFTVLDGGEPVRVEPYLGARGHLVVLRAGDLAYVHAHAEDDRLAFDVPFPSPGSYRLFLQFKVGGSVHLAAAAVRV